MTKKPIRRYTVDGKLMTPDDLRRLRDYLSDIEVVEVISDEMRIVVESVCRVHPQAAAATMIPRGTYFGRPVGEPPKDEAEHYIRCPGCGGWIDCRDLGQAMAHAGDLPHPRRISRNNGTVLPGVAPAVKREAEEDWSR